MTKLQRKQKRSIIKWINWIALIFKRVFCPLFRTASKSAFIDCHGHIEENKRKIQLEEIKNSRFLFWLNQLFQMTLFYFICWKLKICIFLFLKLFLIDKTVHPSLNFAEDIFKQLFEKTTFTKPQTEQNFTLQ